MRFVAEILGSIEPIRQSQLNPNSAGNGPESSGNKPSSTDDGSDSSDGEDKDDATSEGGFHVALPESPQTKVPDSKKRKVELFGEDDDDDDDDDDNEYDDNEYDDDDNDDDNDNDNEDDQNQNAEQSFNELEDLLVNDSNSSASSHSSTPSFDLNSLPENFRVYDPAFVPSLIGEEEVRRLFLEQEDLNDRNRLEIDTLWSAELGIPISSITISHEYISILLTLTFHPHLHSYWKPAHKSKMQ